MLNVIEDVRNEFKVKLTDKLEEEVISFLNTKVPARCYLIKNKRYTISATILSFGAITKRVMHTFITNSFVFDKLIIM